MLQKIKNYIKLPDLADIPLDSPNRPAAVRDVILHKQHFLKKLYLDFYKTFQRVEQSLQHLDGDSLELGSGGGFLQEIIPTVITSDIVPCPSVDRVENAYHLNFADNGLKAIYMVDVLHHLGNVELFFEQAERCLQPGGKIVMIEPYCSAFGSFIYKYIHHEGYDTKTKTWKFPDTGPLSSANSALPTLIFHRDRKKFEKQFPTLAVETIKYHTFLLYLLSGGLSFRQLVPTSSYKPFYYLERALSPLMKHGLACFQTITITKR